MGCMRRIVLIASVLLAAFLLIAAGARPGAKDQAANPRLAKAFVKPANNGWVFVHLEGRPADIGFQHGYLLASEIADTHRAIKLLLTHGSKPWTFFRDAAERVLWPKIEEEYREEINGIVEGLAARGVKLDRWDLVAHNAFLEFDPYYVKWVDKNSNRTTSDRCSAFVATGSWTADGKIVIAHNNWSDYLVGSRWNIIFDIVPARGQRILMDGMPGLIHSGDDFGINAAGIAITETTISQFEGFDPNGVPEFARARKAMQYATSIDEFAAIMKNGNNGGYANNWLVADRKTNEVADLELGLKNVNLRRTKDGYFIGSNFPVDEKLAREETTFDLSDRSVSANARRIRWEDLMKQHKGKINLALAQKFMGDHFDTFEQKEQPNERTLCGHIDLSPRGSKPWQPPFGMAGAVQNKAADATLVDKMSLTASMGHSCGIHFKAGKHLKQHPEFAWQKGVLRDLDSHAWTLFKVTQ
jgi:hypothetical protein